MSIEQNYDVAFVADLALREKQIQQRYRPIIAVHKWFARRPGSLFRALTLSEFGDRPVGDAYFEANSFPEKRVADPFMGGGTPLIEANRVGCDVAGFDINPVSAWIVQEEIAHLDLDAYDEAVESLLGSLQSAMDRFYRTDCPAYGDKDVAAKYFIWIKDLPCSKCGERIPLWPGYRIADDSRHTAHVVACGECLQLNERASVENLGSCDHCASRLALSGPAKRGRCECPSCGFVNRYPRPAEGPPRHRLVAIEYANPARSNGRRGRFFKAPDAKDIATAEEADRLWQSMDAQFVPDQEILPGDETARLHRWGYRKYRELFNSRQLLGLELSARHISSVKDERLRRALATNFSDLLRYQNMLCRYSTSALKSLDIFSVHGFPVGLTPVESNFLGIVDSRGANVGSGGWRNITGKYRKAKAYCEAPFEIRRNGSKSVEVPVSGEWIGETSKHGPDRDVLIQCTNSADVELEPASIDAVFTDPPYFGNVQYGELMDFCYVWLRSLLGEGTEGFARATSRGEGELTGNQTAGRTIERFAEGLATVYSRMARALKPGGPLAFTFHHNKLEAYEAVGVAILDAGLTCTAALPCPAEMAGSIHIHGTGSSIIDTVFVCRSLGAATTKATKASCRIGSGSGLDMGLDVARVVAADLEELRKTGMRPTNGDTRCIAFGHLTRFAILALQDEWDKSAATGRKLSLVGEGLRAYGDPSRIVKMVESNRHSRRDAGSKAGEVIRREGVMDAVPV